LRAGQKTHPLVRASQLVPGGETEHVTETGARIAAVASALERVNLTVEAGSTPRAQPAHDYQIAARLERLPIARWHTRVRLVVGFAWFFDSFDALAIAYVLPVLVPLWKLNPVQISSLIAIGYAGQALGSVYFGYTAERRGRIPALLWSVALFSVTSLLCAAVWSYTLLLTIRFVQGLGLGGEIPVGHSYMNEIAKASQRGRFILLYQLSAPLGISASALAGVWIVPNLGWQWMFVLGAVPALIMLPLIAGLPESPRWLASRSQVVEADRVLSKIEAAISDHGLRPLPPIPERAPAVVAASTRFSDLLRGIYLRRTLVVWSIYFCTYLVTYGLTGWLPTIYRTVYHLSVRQALNFSFITTLVSLAGSLAVALLIDHTGRKPWISAALILGALPLFVLTGSASMSANRVLILVALGLTGVNTVALAMGMYTAENYPTHLRSLGGGVAAAWLRVAAMIGPYVVGFVLPAAGMGAVFSVFGGSALLGGLICMRFAIETRNRVMEELAPVV